MKGRVTSGTRTGATSRLTRVFLPSGAMSQTLAKNTGLSAASPESWTRSVPGDLGAVVDGLAVAGEVELPAEGRHPGRRAVTALPGAVVGDLRPRVDTPCAPQVPVEPGEDALPDVAGLQVALPEVEFTGCLSPAVPPRLPDHLGLDSARPEPFVGVLGLVEVEEAVGLALDEERRGLDPVEVRGRGDAPGEVQHLPGVRVAVAAGVEQPDGVAGVREGQPSAGTSSVSVPDSASSTPGTPSGKVSAVSLCPNPSSSTTGTPRAPSRSARTARTSS